MFHSIRGSLEKRGTSVESHKSQQYIAQEVVSSYITECFGNTKIIARLVIAYDTVHHQLSIEAGSKTIASELLLRAGDMSSLLRQKGIKVKRLVVR